MQVWVLEQNDYVFHLYVYIRYSLTNTHKCDCLSGFPLYGPSSYSCWLQNVYPQLHTSLQSLFHFLSVQSLSSRINMTKFMLCQIYSLISPHFTCINIYSTRFFIDVTCYLTSCFSSEVKHNIKKTRNLDQILISQNCLLTVTVWVISLWISGDL